MTYTYINDIGRIKNIEIDKQKNGDYKFGIIDVASGEFLGAGEMTEEKWEIFKEHYGIREAEKE